MGLFEVLVEQVPTPIWIALLPVALILLYRSLQPRPLPGGIPIAYPRGYTHIPWLIGFGKVLGERLKADGGVSPFISELGEDFGPVFQIIVGPAGTWLSKLTGFGEVLVACNDGQEMEEACTRRANAFAKSQADAEPFMVSLPTGQISLLSGPKHRHHRRVFGPSMTGGYLAKMVPRIEHSVDDLVALWRMRQARATKNGEEALDVSNDFILSAMDVITSLAFGKAFNGVNNVRDFLRSAPSDLPASGAPQIPRLTECVLQLLKQVASVAFAGPLGRLYTLYYAHVSPTTRNARGDLVKEMDGRIAAERKARMDRGAESGRPSDADHVLAMVLDVEEADIAKGVAPLPHNELVDELLTYVFGGSETTSTALAWGVKYFGRNPEVQRRLRSELAEHLPGALPSASDLRQGLTYAQLNDEALLPYTHATVYEILRLAQVAGGFGRTTVQDTTLLGYHVPSATRIVFLGAWASASATAKKVQAREEAATKEGRRGKDTSRKWGYWGDDVAEFRPERWLKLAADGKTIEFDRLSGPWLPFGAGARGCFGRNLAVLELKVFVVKLIGAFFFESLPSALDDDSAVEVLTRHPTMTNIRITPYEPTRN